MATVRVVAWPSLGAEIFSTPSFITAVILSASTLRDLAALPLMDAERVLLATITTFRPSLLVFSWRDIQIYAPVDGRGGNPLQNSFEVFYARNPLRRLRGALGGLRLMTSHYGELWRNLRLLRRGLRRARRFRPEARAVLGGGAVSVFYEQLGRSLPPGTSDSEAQAMVRRIVEARAEDGQLVGSGLGPAERELVIRAFVRVWKRMRHRRIPYPIPPRKAFSA